MCERIKFKDQNFIFSNLYLKDNDLRIKIFWINNFKKDFSLIQCGKVNETLVRPRMKNFKKIKEEALTFRERISTFSSDL